MPGIVMRLSRTGRVRQRVIRSGTGAAMRATLAVERRDPRRRHRGPGEPGLDARGPLDRGMLPAAERIHLGENGPTSTRSPETASVTKNAALSASTTAPPLGTRNLLDTNSPAMPAPSAVATLRTR
jgi:hypothetical protein